jgi:protein-disulfide isomerase
LHSSLPVASLPVDRRTALVLGASALVVAVPAFAQRRPAGPDTVAVEDLMRPIPGLPDLFLGKADAPCTIVEYASMTCGHCANFHTKVFPTIKEKYVDTGKVRFVLREFPLDDWATAASMLARCAGKDKVENAYLMTGILFARQEQWAFTRSNRVAELFKIAQQAGFTQDSFDKCLTDDALTKAVEAAREHASKSFGVSSTPTFFLNGRRLKDGESTIDGMSKAIDAVLTKS